jgi:hypothetical protein
MRAEKFASEIFCLSPGAQMMLHCEVIHVVVRIAGLKTTWESGLSVLFALQRITILGGAGAL